MVPRVEEIVAAQLANDPVERIPDGYRLSNEFGVTDLTFRPVASDPGPFELSTIATVETRFLQGVPEFTSASLARLNRRSVFGNFYKSNDGLRSKLTFSIFREELAAEWVAHLLLIAFERQLPFGIGAAQSELSEEHFRVSRANLDYPTTWGRPVRQEEIEACGVLFQKAGLVSGAGPKGLVLEVPLAEGRQSRTLDPTSESALIHLHTDVGHPLAGVGFLGTIALPFDPQPGEIAWWCEHLNAREHEQEDFAPRLGAWGARAMNHQLVYTLFWPTDRGSQNSVLIISNWLVERTRWLGKCFWEAGVGLSVDTASSDD